MLDRAWQDHVVHVEMFTADVKPMRGYVNFLVEKLTARDAFVAAASPGVVEVRSEPESPVTAADVAGLLAGAGLPAAAVHERLEWSIGRT